MSHDDRDREQGSVYVTLSVPPALEEGMVDWLLAGAAGDGFSGHQAYGHGSRHDHLSIAEQVSGRQKRVEFHTEIAAGLLDEFLASLDGEFRGADVYYVVAPVLRSGHLRQT